VRVRREKERREGEGEEEVKKYRQESTSVNRNGSGDSSWEFLEAKNSSYFAKLRFHLNWIRRVKALGAERQLQTDN